MNERNCANPKCGKAFSFHRRDYTTPQVYCNKECRIAVQIQRQLARRRAARASAPKAPRKSEVLWTKDRRPIEERRSVMTVAVAQAREMVRDRLCPVCDGTLAHDDALVYCRNRATARCDWMLLLTQRERDPRRDADEPDDDSDDPSPDSARMAS